MPAALIIDEHLERRWKIRRTLRAAGLRVWEAESAKQGLELVRTRNFPFIFAGMNLPDMQGPELLRRMRFAVRGATLVALCEIKDLSQLSIIIESGAVSVLDMQASPGHLAEQVRNVLISRAAAY